MIDALEQKPCTFSTLDGRILSVAFDEQISPSSCKLVSGEGMPIPKAVNETTPDQMPVQISSQQEQEKGDLYIRFDIQFPKDLTQRTKTRLLAALAANEQSLGQ